MTHQEVPGRPAEDHSAPVSRTLKERCRGPQWLAIVFLVAFVVLAFSSVRNRDFWSESELRNASIVQTMVATGDWVTPSFGGEPYLRAPPLLYWLAGAVDVAIGGDARWTYRLPTALCAALSLWLTYLLAARLFGNHCALLALAIQSSSIAFFFEASWFDSNLLFATCCQMSITGFVLALQADPWRGWAFLGWGGLGLAALSKSLVLAFVVVGVVVVLFLLVGGGLVEVVRARSRLMFTPAIAFFVAIVAPWFAAVYSVHGSFFLVEQTEEVLRLGDRAEPFYAHLPLLFFGFLPWTIHVIHGFYHGKDRLNRTGERYAIVTTVSIVVLLALFPSKKSDGLLLAWPAIATLAAAAILERRERYSLWEGYLQRAAMYFARYVLFVPAAVVVLAWVGFGLEIVFGWHVFAGTVEFVLRLFGDWPAGGADSLQTAFDDRAGFAAYLGVVTIAGFAAVAYSRRLGRRFASEEFVAGAFELACVTVFLWFVVSFSYAGMNALKSSRAFMAKVDSTTTGTALAAYGRWRGAYDYYLDRSLGHFPKLRAAQFDDETAVKLREFVGRPTRIYVVSSRAEVVLLERDFPSIYSKLSVVASGRLGWSRSGLLLTNGKPVPPVVPPKAIPKVGDPTPPELPLSEAKAAVEPPGSNTADLPDTSTERKASPSGVSQKGDR